MAFLTPDQAVIDHPTFGMFTVVAGPVGITTRTPAQAVIDHPTFGMFTIRPGTWPHNTLMPSIGAGGAGGGSVGYAT